MPPLPLERDDGFAPDLRFGHRDPAACLPAVPSAEALLDPTPRRQTPDFSRSGSATEMQRRTAPGREEPFSVDTSVTEAYHAAFITVRWYVSDLGWPRGNVGSQAAREPQVPSVLERPQCWECLCFLGKTVYE